MKYLVLLTLLCGCATTPPIEYRVTKGPTPPVIEVPVLREATTNQDKAQSLAEYIANLKAKLAEAIAALEVYR
jgi:predicted component of type VI protein secretion system